MITSNIPNLSSMSMVRAKVDFFNGSTLVQTCTCGDYLEDFELTREGDNSKFFGFGICHKAIINLIDLHRTLKVTKDNTVEIGLGDGSTWDTPYPTFYISELKRDERTNTITASAYDKIYWAGEYLFKDLNLAAPYTIRQVAQAIATKLGISLNIPSALTSAFALSYTEGANIDGTEDLRSILNWIAEATQTIYYINYADKLTFKRLDKNGAAVSSITKDDYYELNTQTPRTLTTICHTTELGDNVEASTGDGAIQYVRNNPFLELRNDLATILDNAIAAVGGTTITQFDCDWSGNYLLEIGDKIALTTEDGGIVNSYLLSDMIEFAGTLNERSEWEYTDQQPETYANPTNIGDRINQTFAKVNKIEKNITLYVGEIVNEVLPTKIEDAVENITTELNKAIEDVESSLKLDISNAITGVEADFAGDLSDLESSIAGDLSNLESGLNKNISDTAAGLSKDIGTVETNLNKAIADAVANLEDSIDDLEATTSTQTKNIASLTLTTTSINNEVSSLKTTTTNITNDLGDVVAAQTTIQENIAQLQITDNSINQEVSGLKTTTTTLTDDLNDVVITQETIQDDVAALKLSSNQITASVSSVETRVTQLDTDIDSVSEQTNSRIDTLSSDVALKLDKTGVEITIDKKLEDGVDKVVTSSKKYTFDDTGLNVSSADSEISTKVTEDGMRISKNTQEVLTVNNQGVKAQNLHAYTFLIIGENSRMEDRGNRTACFWIGPAGG